MNVKIIIGGGIILAGLVFGALSFVQTSVEYADFQGAISSHKRVQVKGEWQQDKETRYDNEKGQFVFFMKDDRGSEMKVIFDGAKPNNFELANAIVVKGRAEKGCFHASEILTKCPSKYESASQPGGKNL